MSLCRADREGKAVVHRSKVDSIPTKLTCSSVIRLADIVGSVVWEIFLQFLGRLIVNLIYPFFFDILIDVLRLS